MTLYRDSAVTLSEITAGKLYPPTVRLTGKLSLGGHIPPKLSLKILEKLCPLVCKFT